MKQYPKLILLSVTFALLPTASPGWSLFLDGSALPQDQGWTLDGSSAGTVANLDDGNKGLRQTDAEASGYSQWYVGHTAQAATLGARFAINDYAGGPVNLLQLTPATDAANPGPKIAIGIRGGILYLLRVVGDDGATPPAPSTVLADLGPVEVGLLYEAHLHIDNKTERVRLFWNGSLRYANVEDDLSRLVEGGEGRAEFGASNRWPENDRSGRCTITFDWVGLGDANDLPLALPFVPWNRYLDGSILPSEVTPAWQLERLPTSGETTIVDFVDPFSGGANQALQVISEDGDNDWYEGAFLNDEILAGTRFRLAEFSAEGRENLLSVTTVSDPLAPSPSLTLVDGRYKLWSYIESDVEILDIGEAVAGEWHTAYLYARKDGQVKLWWDGKVIFDDVAPRVNPYDGYIEWGSGSWQRSASTTVEFDWVGYGVQDTPEAMITVPANASLFQDPTPGFSFTAASASGIPANGFTLSVNGVDRTPDLIITGEDSAREGLLRELAPNQQYRIVLTVKDSAGSVGKHTVQFDTFSPESFVFEAEDWNFDQGGFIDAPTLSSSPDSGSYFGTTAAEDIDYHELGADPGVVRHDYRDSVLVGTERAGDLVRQPYLDAQVDNPEIADYAVTGVVAGEWLNYTRTFPRGLFHVYGRIARASIQTPFEATVEKVNDASSSTQQTTPLGQLRNGAGRGWPTYYYEPLTDAGGVPIVVSLAGKETLRITCTSGSYKANYYMLVPAPASLSLSHTVDAAGLRLRLSWQGSGVSLEYAPSLNGPWRAVENLTNPYVVPIPTAGSRFFRLRE